MDISKIDDNFRADGDNAFDGLTWIKATDERISAFGVFYGDEGYYRIPRSVAQKVSGNVAYLSTHVSGGRVAFKTDSPVVALRGKVKDVAIMSNMALFGVYGFSLYQDKQYRGTIVPERLGENSTESICPDSIDRALNDKYIPFIGKKLLSAKREKTVRVNFPLYTGCKELEIGIKEGCFIKPCNPYKNAFPIVFYGSSITQGACASRPGLDYASLVAERLGYDYFNFGLAGNCKGEKALGEYIGNTNASLYIFEYDHNAPTAEYLQQTHYAFYRTVRDRAKDTPIMFLSRPSAEYFPDADVRRDIVKETYERAKKEGDNKVYFVDGRTLYGRKNRTVCTADTCHPNDIGFYRMYQAIVRAVKKEKIL